MASFFKSFIDAFSLNELAIARGGSPDRLHSVSAGFESGNRRDDGASNILLQWPSVPFRILNPITFNEIREGLLAFGQQALSAENAADFFR
jgi:hypothetical protein